MKEIHLNNTFSKTQNDILDKCKSTSNFESSVWELLHTPIFFKVCGVFSRIETSGLKLLDKKK
jgi:hypothetical protein